MKKKSKTNVENKSVTPVRPDFINLFLKLDFCWQKFSALS